MNFDTELPRVIFLSGSSLKKRRHWSAELANFRPDVLSLGFREPLRGAVLGTFFQCDPLLDLQAPNLKLPGITNQSDVFQDAYWLWLRQTYGEGVLGRIMLGRFQEYAYHDTFIFEESLEDHRPDMEAIVKEVGLPSCVLVDLVKKIGDPTIAGIGRIGRLPVPEDSSAEDFPDAYTAWNQLPKP